MNHKDLLDNVVESMSSSSPSLEDKVIEDIKSDEELQEMIKIPSVTGQIYEIDPKTYNWEDAILHIPQIRENADTLTTYSVGMMNIIGHENEKDVIDWLNNVKETLSSFLSGYNMEVNFKELHPDITLYQEVMMLLYDCNTVTNILLSEIRNYGTITLYNSLFMGGDGIHMPETDYDTEALLDDEEYHEKMWKVSAIDGEGGVEITSIVEHDGPYELIDINSKHSEDNMFWTLVVADTQERARRVACGVFGCINPEVDIDDHMDSGLVS